MEWFDGASLDSSRGFLLLGWALGVKKLSRVRFLDMMGAVDPGFVIDRSLNLCSWTDLWMLLRRVKSSRSAMISPRFSLPFFRLAYQPDCQFQPFELSLTFALI